LFRAAIVESLGALAARSGVEGLNLALQDDDPDVRVAACEAWGRHGGPEALHALASTLNGDTDLDVRQAATRGLGELGDPAGIQTLGVALEDPDPALQWRAVQSLEAITGRDFGDSVPACREFVQNPPPGSVQPQHPSLVKRLRRLF
jgi:HEAT repeat protein